MTINLERKSKQPPPIPNPLSDPASNAARLDSAVELAVSDDTEVQHLSTRRLLLGSAASGYYLSLVLHVIGYATAAGLFVYFGRHLVEEDDLRVSVRATLSDKDMLDKLPKLEIVQDISMSPPNGLSQAQQLSSIITEADNGTVSKSPFDMQTMNTAKVEEKTEDATGDFLFRLPESGMAVTKGSFTAWTSPESPSPGQRYNIIIIIRLPDTVKAYRVSDMNGTVIGSDGFRQKLPFDSARMSASFYTDENNKLQPITGRETITVRNNQVQLVISIPGAERLTRDVIKVSSKRLRERQELELVFGGAKNITE